MRQLLIGSDNPAFASRCPKVQILIRFGAYRRCIGAARDAYAQRAGSGRRIEINSATDNPLVFREGDILSGGIFMANL